ncbi:hypothetical protein EW146_g5217 [Bondarzewia mesenterica]|uniref:Major facilitator superfamily (MFS) profile domain-containing protein n=1 Tax=Bondarzewia mesenterica TaxID=1095465 RepID=A0A4S4LXZ0_9AGAM|nr:hypothetical protein EW146_g5217 [Bondarzewia mesenterica]
MSQDDSRPSSTAHEKALTGVQEIANGTPLYNAHIDVSDIDERKLIRKIDLRLIPWLALLYLLSFLDRTSIGNAKLYGMEKDLHISDQQYLIGLTIFFFSYSIFEVPSNVFLKRLRPSIWLSVLMLLWGVMMLNTDRARTNSQLWRFAWYALDARNDGSRVISGCELLPLMVRHSPLSSTVSRRTDDLPSVFADHKVASVSGAFGGLLAAAISNMGGIGGKPAWAWIFILEGLATVLAGVLSFWIIQDFPDTARFLSEAERTVVVRRLQRDDQFSAAGEKLQWKYVWKSIFDWKTWIGMMVYTGSDMPLYAFSLFLPTIISQVCPSFTPSTDLRRLVRPSFSLLLSTARRVLIFPYMGFLRAIRLTLSARAVRSVGFKATPANLLTVPVGFLCLGAAGYIILIASRNAALSYVAVYLATCGIYPLIPNTIAWVSNNVEGSYKRSVTLAMVISFGNINGAVSSNVYRARDQPWYTLGHGIVLLYIGLGVIASVTYYTFLRRENARRDRGERDEVIEGVELSGDVKETAEEREIRAKKNGWFASVEDAKTEKGDEWSGYRYTL